jgi:general secretion pathway protein C
LSNFLKETGWARRIDAATAATVILTAALALQTARIGWAALAPIGPVGAPEPTTPSGRQAADFATLDRFDPFFRVAAASAARPPSGAVSALKLFGVRAGRDGSAIISVPGGRQLVFLVGETVVPGVTLHSIASDHVVLSAEGRRSTLVFGPPNAEAPVIPAAFTPPPPPPPLSSTAAEAIARAGMLPGDVLVSVNGRPVEEPGQAEAFAREAAAQRGDATVQFERDGQTRTATLNMSNP